jgi:hypothetical protein
MKRGTVSVSPCGQCKVVEGYSVFTLGFIALFFSKLEYNTIVADKYT